MRLILIYVVSWLGGLAAYVACLSLLWGQTLSGGDLMAVLSWSAVASAIAVAVVYAPLMFALRRRTQGNAGLMTYASAAVIVGVIPVLLITTIFGGTLRSVITPEAMLFYCMFSAFGLVFGAGFSLGYGKRPSVTSDAVDQSARS